MVLHEEAVAPEFVADKVVKGIAEEWLLTLPHAEVQTYFENKVHDYDRMAGWNAKTCLQTRSVIDDTTH